MGVEIDLLGGFSVTVDGHRVPDQAWSRRHAAALVQLLALRPGRWLPREQVIDFLWPDLLVHEAAPRLHKAAHFARKALGVPDSLALTGDVVSPLPDAEVSVDVHRFDGAAQSYFAGGGLTRADEAIRLYRGPLLPEEPYAAWAEQERAGRQLRYIELLKEAGRWDEVLATDPLDEEAHLRLVDAHIEQGDRGAALRQLDFMAQVWRRELDSDAGPAAAERRTAALALPAYDANRPPARRRPTPVPRPATPTVGRDDDQAEVHAILEEGRVVTLLGPGGVGKTRLAQEVAHRHAQAAGEDVCFVDLTKVRDADLVPELVVRALGVHPGSGRATEMLEEVLRGSSMLLVLDNFEHVIEAATLVTRLVQHAPDMRVLATSRARLRVAGERVFDVEPLGVDDRSDPGGHPDAVLLFEQAATHLDPAFRLDVSIDDVIEICRSVAGLPLAIEVAAGHLRTLPPAMLRSRLDSLLDSPIGAPRDAPERQQTIAATIDWSLQLLGDEERRLFARLGIFNGPVPLEAVEGICSPDDVVEPLSRLVDQSLVRRVVNGRHEPRYVLLELVRDRARDLLGGDLDALAARHAAYLTDFLEDLDERRWTNAADRWIDDITEVLAEIRAAHDWAHRHDQPVVAARIAASLGTYWHLDGHHAEGRQWVEQAMATETDLTESTSAALELAAGFVLWPVDQLAARTHWELAVVKFRAIGDTRMLAFSLPKAAATYLGYPEHFDLAILLCDEGIALSRNVGEGPLIAQGLNVRGELTRVAGRDDLARAAYEEGRDLAIAAGDDAHLSLFLANLSYIAEHDGDYREARRLGCEALRLASSQGRRLMSAWTVDTLAGAELGLGRPERGAVLVGAADQALDLLGVGRHPGDMPEHRRVTSGLREALGDGRYETLHGEGELLSLDQAVTLAMTEPGAATEPDGPR